MKTRLVLVEGLPASGKSTTSKLISEYLTRKGIKTKFVDEGTGNHPADYEFHSYISADKLNEFSDDDKAKILAASVKAENGVIVSLAMLKDELFEKALQYKIYDFLPWNVEQPLMLDKWSQFVNNAENDTTYVFNCCFLQNPMCETMVRFGYDLNLSAEHIQKIADIVKPLNPVCVYLDNDNFRPLIKNVSAERGEEWLNSVIDYHVNGEYGKAHNLSEFDGYIDCLNERRTRELQILNGLDIQKIIVSNPSANWKNAFEYITEQLEKLV